MARVIPPGFAECSIEHWLDGYPRPAVTTMGVKIAGSEAEGESVADWFHEAFILSFLPSIDANVRVRNARAVIGQDGADPIVQISTKSTTGSSTRDSVAPALALMIAKNTALGGRKNRGRFYFPWAVSDTGVDEAGNVQESTLSTWRTNADTFMTNLSGGLGTQPLFEEPVVLHSDPLLPPTPITGMAPNPTIRTQRRRQIRF